MGSTDNSHKHNMKCMIVVLAVASLCLAEPEADPAYLYAPYHAYPYFYRPYAASGYAGPLPGASYQSVHRLQKREAEADPQVLLAAGAAPYVNEGPVSGPLTAAIGDLVATERGYVPLSLEGFSEDLNEDGFVDPIAPAVAAPVVHAAPVVAPAVAAPLVHAAPAVQVAAPVVNAPFINNFFHAAPFAAAPFVAPVAPAVAAALVHHIPAPVAHVAAPVAAHVPFVPRSHVIK